MTPYITETLEEISKSPDMLLTRHRDSFAVKTICQYAFDKNMKFELPEGEPPFKPDAAPLGMSPANFYQQVKKFYIFCRKDLSAVRREQLFIQLIEGLHPSEAKVCIAIKDQNLTSLYPGITADLVVKAGFVSEANVFREPVVQGKKEPKGKQLVVNLSDGATAKESFGKPTKPVEESKPEPKPEVQAAPKKRGRPKKAA